MHQVLQRTRPAADSGPASRLWTLLRSFVDGKRGLVLLLLVGGATLGSQGLHRLLRPGSAPATGTPGGGVGGPPESAASADPALLVGRSSSIRSSSIRGGTADAPPIPERSGESSIRAQAVLRGMSATASPGSADRHGQLRPLPIQAAVVRRDRDGDSSAAAPSLPAPSMLGLAPLSRPHQGVAAGQSVMQKPWTAARPSRAGAAILSPQGLSARAAADDTIAPQPLDTATSADVGLTGGAPCHDSMASLPSDRPPEEAWLPGGESTLALNPAARVALPGTPVEPDVPTRSEGSSSHSLSATRTTPCPLKQPVGRN